MANTFAHPVTTNNEKRTRPAQTYLTRIQQKKNTESMNTYLFDRDQKKSCFIKLIYKLCFTVIRIVGQPKLLWSKAVSI